MRKFIHTLKEEFQTLDRSGGALRKFGFVVGGVCIVFWMVSQVFFTGGVPKLIAVLGMILVVLAVVSPGLLLWPYYLWMGSGIILGLLVGPLLLATLFFIAVTPFGLLKRLWKSLSPKQVQKRDTYWIKRAKGWSREDMEKLF